MGFNANIPCRFLIVEALLTNIMRVRCMMVMGPSEIAGTDGEATVGTVWARDWSNSRLGCWIVEILFAMLAQSVYLGIDCCQNRWRCRRHVQKWL
jgi:hypothetical protein